MVARRVTLSGGRPAPPGRERALRVSFGALLRVRDGGRYVLFRTPARPDSYGPPGGVFKYFEPATRTLERLGFREEQTHTRREIARFDLRGFIPRGSMRGFQRWFAGGAFRETAAECLRRELIEELAEVGFPSLAEDVRGLTFTWVGTTVEGPRDVPGESYRQLRRLEVHDLAATSGAGAALRRRLIDLAADPAVETVVRSSAEEITRGRTGSGLISSQTALLVYARKIHPDIPAVS